MVARGDREFLARVARVNQALAASALPLINNALGATDCHLLGTELIAIGQEFLCRAHPRLGIDSAVEVVDGVAVTIVDGQHRMLS
jgi:hypothetical protein